MTRPLVELFQENRATGQGCASPEEGLRVQQEQERAP